MNSWRLFPDHFKQRLIVMLVSVFILGFILSIMISINFGTDPYSCFNYGASAKLHISFGNWQLLLNLLMFLIVIRFNRHLIGFCTLANMVLIGYLSDFFRYIWAQILPENFFEITAVRWILLFPTIAILVIGVSGYIAADLGVAPYDAIPFIITEHQTRFSFKTVRILWDIAFTVCGYLLGGVVGIITILVSFLFGPVIDYFKTKITALFFTDSLPETVSQQAACDGNR